ncbi:MAG: hypothetical protein NTX97_03660 [Bacteroidetes bacterium]|nr:hypothetical protein [Bacteroidota bacterium]
MKTKLFFIVTFAFLSMGKISRGQDTIVKQNQEVILAKITEISSSEIKYKRFDNIDGPVYSITKTAITKIKFSNGKVEEMKNETTASTENSSLPADPTPHYILTMTDGTQLRGKVISEKPEEVIFKDNNIGEKTISRKNIKNLSFEFGDKIQVFTLTDGSILTGKIINKTDAYTAIETKGLGIVNLPESKIKSVRELDAATITEAGKIWFKNPNCTRYLFAPSGIPLKKGEGYYQNIYGACNAVNFGLNNHISIGGGLVGPLGAYLNTKVGFDLGKYTHVAAGCVLGNGFFPINGDNFGLGLGFGVVTIGDYDNNITIGAGYGFVNSGGDVKWQEKPLFVANGMTRLGKKYALVTENWIVNVKGDPFNRGISEDSHYETIFSYAFRYMGERSTLDAGFVNTPGLFEKGWYIGIPYIGFVIRFGNYKDN